MEDNSKAVAGSIIAAAGLLGAGKAIGRGIKFKKLSGEIISKYKPILDKNVKDSKNSRFFPFIHKLKALINKNKMESEIYEAASKSKNINKNYDHADTAAMLSGSLLATSGLLGGEKKAAFQATKETEMQPKTLIKPNLVTEPVYYSRATQGGPIIENADKMSKIAHAINGLFPKQPKDQVIEQKNIELDKRDEALAQHEAMHKEKDMKIKQIKSAVKDVNSKLEFYRQKAIENYTQSLDNEANAR